MGFFKKKEPPMAVELKCPADGCAITFDTEGDLKKHIAWKHPDLKSNYEEALKVE